MKKFPAMLLAGLIWGGFGLMAGFAQVSSSIVDAHSGEPIIHAHVYWKSQIKNQKGTATDVKGRFKLKSSPVKPDTLIIHALGYQRLGIPVAHAKPELPDPIKLWPGVYHMKEELLVQGKKAHFKTPAHQQRHFDAAKRLENQHAGASLIKRGPHAAELTIRGMSSERLTTRIDDVPVFSACVDKMDPVTSYVNPSSIGSLKRTGEQLGTPNEMNLQLKKADYRSGWMAEVQSHYLTAARHSKVNGKLGFGSERWTWEADAYWMQADNMVAGGGKEIANSAQNQFNGSSSFRYQKDRHEVKVNGAYNHSWDVGYPALLMDATKALSYLGSVDHNYRPRWDGVDRLSTKLYFSRVEHTMDDYGRDVTQREVMRNMYMPMAGDTETIGVRQQWQGSSTDQTWKTGLEWFQLVAFGDMRMESVFDDVADMYLLNLGDIRQQNIQTTFSWNRQLNPDNMLSLNADLKYRSQQVRDEASARYFRTLFGNGQDQVNTLGWYASVEWTHTFDRDLKIGTSISTRHRAPTYKELFGYYIYNYEDGFFYNGNPMLDTERHYTLDALLALDKANFSVQVVPYINYVSNWIDGVFDSGFVGHTGVYQFKEYQNTGDVLLSGVDLRLNWKPFGRWQVSNSTQYTYGQHLEWKEPLRMISPLNGNVTLGYYREKWNFEADWNWATKQNRIAKTNAIEDETPGYHVIGLTGNVKVAQSLNLTLQLQNLLDEYYWTHTSIGNIPSTGRTVQLSVRWAL